MFHPQGPTVSELVRQGLSSTQKGYDLLAPKFNYTPFRTPDFLVESCLDHLKPLGPFECAADICTGTGAGVIGLLALVSKQVIGIDWSLPMLLEAKRTFETRPLVPPSVDFICQNMFEMEHPEKFDLVTSFGANGHIEKHRYQEFVDKIASMLRPGGSFVFVTAERPSILSPQFLVAFIFDTVMKLRNLLIQPKFIMYYLNFLLPEILPLFQNNNWDVVTIIPLRLFNRPTPFRMVIARKSNPAKVGF